MGIWGDVCRVRFQSLDDGGVAEVSVDSNTGMVPDIGVDLWDISAGESDLRDMVCAKNYVFNVVRPVHSTEVRRVTTCSREHEAAGGGIGEFFCVESEPV